MPLAEGVTNIVNLQEDKDFAYWGVDFEAYRRRAAELGLFLDRRPVRRILPSFTMSQAIWVNSYRPFDNRLARMYF